MAPTPDIHSEQLHHEVHGERRLDAGAVVISGISTALPNSHNMLEFSDQLYDKKNFLKINSPRWKYKNLMLSNHHGIIPDLDRFDAQFFMIFHKLSLVMDPMTRKLLEHSYQAIFDAGICPSELSGKKVGVFVTIGPNEVEVTASSADCYFGILGCNRAMCANRISYYLNLKGPSVVIDGDSAGSSVALRKAYESIMTGECEAALVGAAMLLQHPHTPFNYHKLVPLCTDGDVKCYDMNANGHALSEATALFFLQKYKDAKRVYTSIRHIDVGFTGSTKETEPPSLGVYRDPEVLIKFFRNFYQAAKISPTEVEYVEGFGSAVLDADKAELDAIDEVFCKDRTNTLAVGSVLSNVGFTHSVSCLTSIVKLCLAYHKGSIAANINCENPRVDVAGIAEGRLRILTEHAPFQRTFTAVNNLSAPGANAHVLLQGEYKPKNLSQYHTDIPHLILASGRQESGVEKILNNYKNLPLDPEEIALVRNIHRMRIPKHLARGFGIYTMNENQETKVLCQKAYYYDERKRPLWFVYSGMGSQWAGMGTQLMRIPVFAASIEKCHKVLEPKGLDLINIITSTDNSTFDNILNSFVGIAAIQIGLTDVLKTIGLVPDNIIGHSVGELGCAYADGCLSAEEMILMAYSRGLVSVQTPFIRGSMAAVGIGYKQISKMVPPEIEVACHNGPNSSTISGPADAMKQFVATLTEQSIFAKEVPCSNIAYHSRYIAEAGPSLLSLLKTVVKEPKTRSYRWYSTSIPQENWNEPLAKYSSAEYHTNNLLSPVLFEETLRLVPANAVLVEIAPHGLLQAILKRSLPESCRNVALTRRGHIDNTLFLLEAIGNLYMEGYDIDVSPLYPKINYPVSTETRPLSQLVEWVYDEKMKICQFSNLVDPKIAIYKPIISHYDEEHEYLSGNVIDGKRLFPFTGALVLAWDTLAMTVGQQRQQISVQFKDITFHAQPVLRDDKALHITSSLHRGSGRFEVSYEFGIVAEGYITELQSNPELPEHLNLDSEEDVSTAVLTKNDVYKLFYERGYQYSNEFQSIESSNVSFGRAQLAWKNNWVTFLDGIVQLNILKRDHKEISQLRHINCLCIDVDEQTKQKDGIIDVRISNLHKFIKCGGVTLQHNVVFKDKSSVLRDSAGLKELKFLSFNQTETVDVLTYLYVYIQIIAENLNKNDLNVLSITSFDKPCLLDEINRYLDSPPEIKLNNVLISKDEILHIKKHQQYDFIFLHDVVLNKKDMEALYNMAAPNTFMIKLNKDTEEVFPITFYRKMCAAVGKRKENLELAKWKPSKPSPITAAITVRNSTELEYFKAKRDHILGRKDKLLILTPYPAPSGLKDLVKEWNSKSNTYNINLVMTNKIVEDDIMNVPNIDLVFNILDNHGIWGGEYYIPLQDMKTRGHTVSLEISKFGNLNSLKWIEAPSYLGEGIPVVVNYAGLNANDVKRAMAIPINNQNNRKFGMDFSGVTERGDRVMGVIKEGAICGKVNAHPELLWPVPDHWSMEEAATVPLAYCLAFYCLKIKSKNIIPYKPITHVFIHGGAGALGQAVISICLAEGCNVFTTVSDINKKNFLLKMFPTLPAENIGNSRDVTFMDMVASETKRENCQIVIMNTTAANLKQATMNCCGPFGITLDITSSYVQDNLTFGMHNLTLNRFYSTVDFSTIFDNMNLEEFKALQLLVSEGIAQGYVRPLSRIIYSAEDAPRAFRLLAASRHRGRVLLNLLDSMPTIEPRHTYSSDSSHLIFCDHSDLGINFTDRLVNNGVKKIFIHHLQSSAYLQYKITSWQNLGVRVNVSYEKIKDTESVAKILNECNRLAPVEGIYVINVDYTDRSADEVKLLVHNLDDISRKLCPRLRNFAVINDNNEEVSHEVSLKRVQEGLPVLSLQLRNFEKFDDIVLNNQDVINHSILRLQSALDSIENALSANKPILLAYAHPLENNFLNDVISLLGLNIRDINTENLSLEQLGLDEGKAQELSNAIEEKHNIIISKEDFLQMTVAELKTLEEQLLNTKQELSGLGSYLNCIDNDELDSNYDIVVKSTLAYYSNWSPVTMKSELTYLCIVPGLEAHHRKFDTLCGRLKLPALVLQPGFDIIDESIEDMAQRLVDTMTKNLLLENNFYLLGYEIGVLVALEMAVILEKRGVTGVVYCLGGGPEDICATLDAQFGNINLEELQNQIIVHMYTLITQSKSEQLENKIKELEDFEAKVDACIQLIRGQSSHSTDYIRTVINVTYTRILMARDYVWKQPKLSSKIIVIRAKSKTATSSDCSQVTVHQLDSTLPLAPEDLKCSVIVNKYLDPKIIDDFYSQNLCETFKIDEINKITFSFVD